MSALASSWSVLAISSAVGPRAPAQVMASAVWMLVGEKKRLPSLAASWVYRFAANALFIWPTLLSRAGVGSTAMTRFVRSRDVNAAAIAIVIGNFIVGLSGRSSGGNGIIRQGLWYPS